jgi:hypothetical protein
LKYDDILSKNKFSNCLQSFILKTFVVEYFVFGGGGGGAKLQNFDTIDLGKKHWLKYGILDEIQPLNVFEIEFELMLVGYGT